MFREKMRENLYEFQDRYDSKYRLLSELERYEIFNTEEAERYDTQQALDFIIDDEGNVKYIVAAVAGSKFGFFGGKEFVEIPWEYVTKVGANVVVVSADRGKIRRTRM